MGMELATIVLTLQKGDNPVLLPVHKIKHVDYHASGAEVCTGYNEHTQKIEKYLVVETVEQVQAAINALWDQYASRGTVADRLEISDGVTAPGAGSGVARIYVDTADGDLKVVFSDSTVKTIVVDT